MIRSGEDERAESNLQLKFRLKAIYSGNLMLFTVANSNRGFWAVALEFCDVHVALGVGFNFNCGWVSEKAMWKNEI